MKIQNKSFSYNNSYLSIKIYKILLFKIKIAKKVIKINYLVRIYS